MLDPFISHEAKGEPYPYANPAQIGEAGVKGGNIFPLIRPSMELSEGRTGNPYGFGRVVHFGSLGPSGPDRGLSRTRPMVARQQKTSTSGDFSWRRRETEEGAGT